MTKQTDEPWAPVDEALRRAAENRTEIPIWLRDDDAVTTSLELDRLTAMARAYRLPVLLAVIPARADHHLAAFVADEPLITPTQHGFAHINHAAPGQRACELGGDRPYATVLDEIARGRDQMDRLFGARHADILVPPWNRIEPELLPHLDCAALSTFATAHADNTHIDVINCDLDIIDWRNGRRCHPEVKLVRRLAALIDAAAPIGILTHHLVHDDDAWCFLDRAFARLTSHSSVRIESADTLRRKRRAETSSSSRL